MSDNGCPKVVHKIVHHKALPLCTCNAEERVIMWGIVEMPPDPVAITVARYYLPAPAANDPGQAYSYFPPMGGWEMPFMPAGGAYVRQTVTTNVSNSLNAPVYNQVQNNNSVTNVTNNNVTNNTSTSITTTTVIVQTHKAPEIDPTGLTAAVLMLACALAIIHGRRPL